MLAKDIKTGAVVVFEENPVMIENIHVQTPSARGAATLYKYRARNLITRNKVDIVLKGTDSLPEADFAKRVVKLMYRDPTHLHLMDVENYDQFQLALEDAPDQVPYVTESLEGMYALIYEDRCVGLQLPSAVDLNIAECDPAVRGNSATARTKSAKLETGLEIKVPEYIEQGERVRVNTLTGEFVSRA